MPPFIYINGYPGVGKLTVANELCKLLPKSKVFDNHLLIDPAAAIYERSAPEYQPLRQILRREALRSIAASTSTRDITWIFTDQQSSSPLGTSSARDYQNAATTRGSLFISIILNCEIEENLRRTKAEGRGGSANTKLSDVAIVRSIREREDIFHFGDANELELDATSLSPTQAAHAIFQHVEHTLSASNTNSLPEIAPPKRFAEIAGFKHVFIRDLHQTPIRDHANGILCWLQSRPRHHGKLVFLSVVDSTATIQVVAEQSKVSNWNELATLWPETSLIISGSVEPRNRAVEINAAEVLIVSKATKSVHPEIRKADSNLLKSHNSDKLLSSRHLYLRNPLILSLNVFRSKMFYTIRQWFEENEFVDFSAPLITPSILYEPSAAIHISNLHTAKTLFLSQCAGFYLEAGAHAHERVYNLGPSFRNESRTNRHLMEYWHIKAELCSGSMDDIIDLVEIFLRDVSQAMEKQGAEVSAMLGRTYPCLKPPFQRITYRDAMTLLREIKFDIAFGQNISTDAEHSITDHFGGPVWITHKPRSLEPFPYSICHSDNELSMTADLIAPDGFGEICGVAEKSFTREALEVRLKEKGKQDMMDTYGWVLESRDFGMVPHTAFGMGFERVIRWLCGVSHVKDVIPFPRIFGRDPVP